MLRVPLGFAATTAAVVGVGFAVGAVVAPTTTAVGAMVAFPELGGAVAVAEDPQATAKAIIATSAIHRLVRFIRKCSTARPSQISKLEMFPKN